jgi:AcrR family transcriptional regulator
MGKERTKADRKAETHSALVGAARRLFMEHGYAATPTEEIINGAGASRGALYHHFRDKEELFRIVYEEVDREVVRKIVAAARGQEDAWDRLVVGCRTYLAAQHGMIWVTLGQLPGWQTSLGSAEDENRLASFLGAHGPEQRRPGLRPRAPTQRSGDRRALRPAHRGGGPPLGQGPDVSNGGVFVSGRRGTAARSLVRWPRSA